jgi:hypothetical protein
MGDEASRGLNPLYIEANRLRPIAGTELALLSSANISAAAATKPYYVESRLAAASAATSDDARFTLLRDALAQAPSDERARLGAVQSALALRRDNLALTMAQALPFIQPQQPEPYFLRRRFFPAGGPFRPIPPQPSVTLTEAQRAALLQDLAAAAERTDDLGAAQGDLRIALTLLLPAQRTAPQATLQSLAAELRRRADNAAREPIIQPLTEQSHIVQPRISRSAQ